MMSKKKDETAAQMKDRIQRETGELANLLATMDVQPLSGGISPVGLPGQQTVSHVQASPNTSTEASSAEPVKPRQAEQLAQSLEEPVQAKPLKELKDENSQLNRGRNRAEQKRKVLSHSTTCPKCSGLIGIPDNVTGEIRCPGCDERVYICDPETGVTWQANCQPQPAEMRSIPSQPDVRFQKTDSVPKVLNNKKWPELWIGVCLTLGVMGVFAGLTVGWGGPIKSGSDLFAAVILTIFLNPLSWLGMFGIWMLRQNRHMD
jgi:hypothetical protein